MGLLLHSCVVSQAIMGIFIVISIMVLVLIGHCSVALIYSIDDLEELIPL